VEGKFKGMGHATNIFWEAYYFQSVLYVHAQKVLKFLCCFVKEKKFFTKFLLTSMKTFTNPKNNSESRFIFVVLAFPLSHWSIF
jgi:hypothetical protein